MSDLQPEYEGKAKFIVPTSDPNVVIQRFKDDATAFNGVKKGSFEGKGALNNAISSYLFERLSDNGIPTHFIERSDEIDMRVKRLKIIPLEVVVRNFVAGSLQKRTGLPEGSPVEPAIVETYYKNDELGDPILADEHVALLRLVDDKRLVQIKARALEVNKVLRGIFDEAGLMLVDFKMEFGTDARGTVLLGDEISPDTSRLWIKETHQKLDKDVFRQDLGDLVESYQEIATRLGLI